MTKKILICGDSFAVDYSDVSSSNAGWANLLSTNFVITNLAQAGASEYRILKQLKSFDINKVDAIIISHTSPNRIYINEHPVHKDSRKHNSSDLIYSDIDYHIHNGVNNKVLSAAKNYFENIFDCEYHEDIYFLIAHEIQKLTELKPCLHLFTLFDKNCQDFKNHLNLKKEFDFVPGQTNHYSYETNLKIYKLIKDWADSIYE